MQLDTHTHARARTLTYLLSFFLSFFLSLFIYLFIYLFISFFVVCFHFMNVMQRMQNKYAVILFCFQAGWSAGMQAMGPHMYHIWGETNKPMHKAWLNFNQKVWQFQSLNVISTDNPSVDPFLIHFSFWELLWHHSFTKYTHIEYVWFW
jgi:hypothetical protein